MRLSRPATSNAVTASHSSVHGSTHDTSAVHVSNRSRVSLLWIVTWAVLACSMCGSGCSSTLVKTYALPAYHTCQQGYARLAVCGRTQQTPDFFMPSSTRAASNCGECPTRTGCQTGREARERDRI